MKKTFSIAALVLVSLLGARTASADLMLYPTRVVLENKQRAAQVEMINRGDKPETYRISLVNRRMTETGEIVEARQAEPGEQFADEMVRYSPRQVTLQPGVSQTVRLSVRKPAELAAGEYRSHLQFDRLPDVEGEASLENSARTDNRQLSVMLKALVGASIPVIVRHGETAAQVVLDELAIEAPVARDQPPLLAFAIRRDGNRSVYGNLLAEFTPNGGKTVAVASVAGIAVYVPNALRRARLPLKLPDGQAALKNGVLTLSYTTPPDAGGTLLARTELVLP